MELDIDASPVLDVLRNLYKGALRGSKVVDDVVRHHKLTREEANDILKYLTGQKLVINIEKNKSNGEAVYKLTRTGEAFLEERLPTLYHVPPQSGRAGGVI